MCFGHTEEYDANKSGDFQKWSDMVANRSVWDQRVARGEATQEEADRQKAAIGNPNELATHIADDPSGNMEMREVTRQGDVALGRIGIDKAFSNFGDDYYKKYQNDYTGFYYPDLDRQYQEAVGKMQSALAGRGMLESTVGASKLADLTRQQTEARANIGNEAVDASNKLRGTVENAKSSLYAQNEASANPQSVNAQAVGQATALVAPPTYSPLGQIFSNVLDGFSNVAQARQNRATANYKSPYTSSVYGSGKVVS